MTTLSKFNEEVALEEESSGVLFHPLPLPPPIFVVSGSMGTLGEQVARSVMPQFRDAYVPVKVFKRVQQVCQLEEVIAKAVETNATIIHTLANPDMRQLLIDQARKYNVVAIDIVGPLIERLTQVLGIEPVGKPGLYRELNETYFKRISAIEFTLAHDDGMNYQGWPQAEIVLVGVSRAGKTPLSLYLSMLGWKVANVPVVQDIPPRPSLFELDPRRVVGLTIDPLRLLDHRQQRQRRLGAGGNSTYDNLADLYEEIKEARRIFRQGGFRIINVTNKPIETTAGQIIDLVTRNMNETSSLVL